jgi:cysteine-rich repeat protein
MRLTPALLACFSLSLACASASNDPDQLGPGDDVGAGAGGEAVGTAGASSKGGGGNAGLAGQSSGAGQGGAATGGKSGQGGAAGKAGAAGKGGAAGKAGTGGTAAAGKAGAGSGSGSGGTGGSGIAGTGGSAPIGGSGGSGGSAGTGASGGNGGSGAAAGSTSSGCGDGALATGEACDDGNTSPGDGCSADCQWETSCQSDNQHKPIACGETKSGSLFGAYGDVDEVCGKSFKYQDAVFVFAATTTGRVTVTYSADPDQTDIALFVMRGSCHGNLCVGDSTSEGDRHDVSFDAVAGTTYYFDLEAPSEQPDYTLTVSCP